MYFLLEDGTCFRNDLVLFEKYPFAQCLSVCKRFILPGRKTYIVVWILIIATN